VGETLEESARREALEEVEKNQVDQDSIDEIVVETPLVADIDAPEVADIDAPEGEEQRESVSIL